MKGLYLGICLLVLSCKSTNLKNNSYATTSYTNQFSNDFTITFGSCNNTDLPNLLWDDILNEKPNVWIWGGDIVYADTDNAEKLNIFYQKQQDIKGYKKLTESTRIMGTWDDHDYGLNDGGTNFHFKDTSQQLFLDFLSVSKNDMRRKRKGVFYTEEFKLKRGKVKIIVLDTRYYRSNLTDDEESEKRYKPNKYGEGTILGEVQWGWFKEQLKTSDADFNIVVSSIQLLSDKHGYETWGNFPHEVAKFKSVIRESGAKGIVVLSGDRHISDFSKTKINGLPYPLIDFTSSGLTHVASNNKGEKNPYRVGKMVNQLSYGVLKFDIEKRLIIMEMKGDGGVVQQSLRQLY